MILSLDQGTTGTRAILFDAGLKCRFSSYREHAQHYPHSGWVEHDGNELWENTLFVIRDVLAQAQNAGVCLRDIKALGIANQGETVIAFDKTNGKPLSPAIVWQCRRTAGKVEELRQVSGLVSLIKEKTGLLLDPYFSATKMRWLLDNIPDVKAALEAERLCISTLDGYLIWKLTNGASYYTDCTTASRTMLCNIHTLEWDNILLKQFGIPRNVLPDIRNTADDFGKTDYALFGIPIPITGMVVDQQGALFGQGCFEAGMVKATYGTGCFLLMNIGDRPRLSNEGVLTTVAWKIGDRVQYALDGGIYVAGAAIQWMKNGMSFFEDPAETSGMALSLPGNEDVYFVPAFTGLAAPYWDSAARGMIIGLTGATTKEHIVRAALESIAYQVAGLLDAMRAISGQEISMIRADGGVSKNDFLMQYQADMLQIPVYRMKDAEATARGVAMFAGLGAGIWKNEKEIPGLDFDSKPFQPAMAEARRAAYRKRWEEAVRRCSGWRQSE